MQDSMQQANQEPLHSAPQCTYALHHFDNLHKAKTGILKNSMEQSLSSNADSRSCG
jgi:hypothetical protein